MKKPVVRARRVRITLYELDEDLNKKGKNPKPLCELASFQAIFALNSIPMAGVVPLLGDNIQTKTKQVSLEKIYNLSIKNSPVGVYINFLHRYSSKSNRQDRQYWPKKTEICIFKGYLETPMFTVSAYEAGMSLTIQHWLSSLAGVSLLTTASNVNNPDNISVASYGLGIRQSPSIWGNFSLSKSLNIDKIWESGIKEIFTQVMDWIDNKSENKLNPFVELKRKRIRLILNKIESSGTEIRKDLLHGVLKLRTLMAKHLLKESFQSFINMCGWTKLIQVYSPTYLFSVVPQVSKAKIIPSPCIVDKNKAIDLEGHDIFQLSTRPYISNDVSRVVCTADVGSTQANTPIGEPRYVNFGMYPPKGKEKEGLVTVITLPEWIVRINDAVIDQNFPSVYEKPNEAVDKVKKNQKKTKEITEVQNKVGQIFAKYAYLVQAYNGTMATVSLPFRMDICPGAMVKVHSKGNRGTVELYGTVAVVQVNLTSGATPGNTVIQITNIRTSKDIDDDINNPQEGTGYYTEQWSGQGEVLYENEDDNKKDKDTNKDTEEKEEEKTFRIINKWVIH